ncbi:poly(ADP)-ribose polymerase [Fusarium proliferatum]|nr:poly(ADP)-ribose polymerase [Fusarium proliferatum]
MRANKLIENRDTEALSKAIEKFDITKRVADHLKAVNSGATDAESTISRGRRATKPRGLLATNTASRANPKDKQGKAGAGGKSRGNETDQSKSPLKSRGFKKKDTECRHNAQSNPTYHVYFDPSSNRVYDTCLVLTNFEKKCNKFYIIQVVKDSKLGKFWTRTRYGRVGKAGRTSMRSYGSLDEAVKKFEEKVTARSNLKQGYESDKYTIVKRSCNLDPDGEKAIFSPNYDATMLPLGHLTEAAISDGFQCLQELADLLDNPSLASIKYKSSKPIATEKLLNKYYSQIPHAHDFGHKPPNTIIDKAMLKKEFDLLHSISEKKDAGEAMKLHRNSIPTGSKIIN